MFDFFTLDLFFNLTVAVIISLVVIEGFSYLRSKDRS